MKATAHVLSTMTSVVRWHNMYFAEAANCELRNSIHACLTTTRHYIKGCTKCTQCIMADRSHYSLALMSTGERLASFEICFVCGKRGRVPRQSTCKYMWYKSDAPCDNCSARATTARHSLTTINMILRDLLCDDVARTIMHLMWFGNQP